MDEEWFVRVGDKDYGPADIETLREWKREGRVLATNPVRRADGDDWATAADIPELFDSPALPALATNPPTARAQPPQRSLAQLFGETMRIYRAGFFQFLGLTLLPLTPSICSQLIGLFLPTGKDVSVDVRTLVAAAFSFCMLVLSAALVPVYIAGIQIMTSELAAGRHPGFFVVLNQAVRYWLRVAALCIFVYGIFALLMLFALCIPGIVLVMPQSIVAAVVAITLLCLQIWLFGRFFVNVLFWQQFAVLDNAPFAEALQSSKDLARSGTDQPWYRRPKWRGVFIASLWFAFVLAVAIVQEWSALRDYFNQLAMTQDPQVLLQKFTAAQQTARGFDLVRFELGILQRILQPLLGIAFVVVFLDNRPQSSA